MRGRPPGRPRLFFMATVIIPALLRKLTGGRERVVAAGKNLREVIADLDRQFPGMREQLVEGDDLKPSVAVSIDGEVGASGLLERVRAESEIHFLPAIGGGA
jgi:molybdopterin synthase sulfur carrier subunit